MCPLSFKYHLVETLRRPKVPFLPDHRAKTFLPLAVLVYFLFLRGYIYCQVAVMAYATMKYLTLVWRQLNKRQMTENNRKEGRDFYIKINEYPQKIKICS